MVKKYHNNIPQTSPWYREEELKNTIHQESNQLCLNHQDDCKTRKDTKYCIAKQGQNTNPPQTLGAAINNNPTIIEPSL